VELTDLTPMLRTWDFPGTIAFYTEILGFTCTAYEEGSGWAFFERDGIAIMFSAPNQHLDEQEAAFTGSFYFRTEDVDAFWEELKDRAGVCYPLEDYNYGMREFAIYDNNGYVLQFGWPIEGFEEDEES